MRNEELEISPLNWISQSATSNGVSDMELAYRLQVADDEIFPQLVGKSFERVNAVESCEGSCFYPDNIFQRVAGKSQVEILQQVVAKSSLSRSPQFVDSAKTADLSLNCDDMILPQLVAKLDLDRVDPDLIQIDPDSFTKKLLQTIRRNPLISRKLLAVELNASERKIRDSLKNLKDSGFILRQGPDHGGIWRVSRMVKNTENGLGKELGKRLGKKTEVGEKTSELVEKTSEVREKIPELGAKESVDKSEFEILMGTYRRDFRENAYRVYLALVEDPKTDAMRLSQMLGLSENSVGRAIRAMKDIGLLVREGGDKGGRWIVKRGFKA